LLLLVACCEFEKSDLIKINNASLAINEKIYFEISTFNNKGNILYENSLTIKRGKK